MTKRKAADLWIRDRTKGFEALDFAEVPDAVRHVNVRSIAGRELARQGWNDG